MNLTPQLDSIINHAIIGFQFEAIRYSMGTLGAFLLIWILLAPLSKNRKIRAHRSPAKQIKMELLYSLRTILVFVALDIIIFDFAQTGVFKQYQDISQYGTAWLLFSIVLMLVLHDTYFYWAHLAVHNTKLYKRFHLTHHR
jgi:lathosterol oxidase